MAGVQGVRLQVFRQVRLGGDGLQIAAQRLRDDITYLLKHREKLLSCFENQF